MSSTTLYEGAILQDDDDNNQKRSNTAVRTKNNMHASR